MNNKKIIKIIIFMIIFLTSTITTTFANFNPNGLVINNQMQECAYIYIGEKCTKCTLPEGWETTRKVECPQDFTKVTFKATCEPVRSAFCCTSQTEGNGGECEDVVVNLIEKKCAFVRDINVCTSLPKNWAEARNTDRRGKICPSLNYNWLEKPLKCEGDDQIEALETKNNGGIPTKSKFSALLIAILLIMIMVLIVTKTKPENN